MKTTLHFLQTNKIMQGNDKVQSVFDQYTKVQGKLNQTEFIYRQLKERQQQLKK